MRPLTPFATLIALLIFASCAKDTTSPPPTDDDPPATIVLCTPQPGQESYGIQDFPCPATTVQSWVSASERNGSRTRQHAWYLFAGLNQVTDLGRPLWRTWPTSTDVFPGQYGDAGAGDRTAGDRLQLATLPGAKLEHPAPDTPGFTDAELSLSPGINRKNLSLPSAPAYQLPFEEGTELYEKYKGAGCILDPSEPTKASLKDGPNFQNNGDVMVAGVIYSPDAAEWIQNQQLWNAERLDKLLKDGVAHQEMNENAVVLKPMLWPVPGDGYVALPIWDSQTQPDADQVEVEQTTQSGTDTVTCEIYSGFERNDLWTEAVALTAAPASVPFETIQYLTSPYVTRYLSPYDATTCQGQTKTTDPIVYSSDQYKTASLDQFYTFRWTPDEYQGDLETCDRALIDQSALWAYNRPFDPSQDALVLIAMHMITREQPGWTFQSAWWRPDAKSDCGSPCRSYDSHRPTDVTGPDTWENYLVTSTYGITQKPVADGPRGRRWPTDLDNKTTWPVSYNPYIELAATHPIETNCINCHRRAAWPSRIPGHNHQQPPHPVTSSYLSADGPGLLDKFCLQDIQNCKLPPPSTFDDLLTLDAMWAVSDRAYYPSQDSGSNN